MHLDGPALATASGMEADVVEACTARGCAFGVTCVLLSAVSSRAYKDQIPDKGQHTPVQMQAEQSTVTVHAAIACMQL